MYRELLIGCGFRRVKQVNPWKLTIEPIRADVQQFQDWQALTTLDINSECKPDLLCDLDDTSRSLRAGMWKNSTGVDEDGVLLWNWWDEIHAYEVLEHLGSQGDYRSFFWLFESLYNILKPGGFLVATVPSRYSEGLWSDPGHRRAITPSTLLFLDQSYYYDVGTDVRSDYRFVYSGDFARIYSYDNKEYGTHSFVLRAMKPSRKRSP